MQSGKAPGIDGLPAGFYKIFWSVGADVLSVLTDSLAGGRLVKSYRRLVITLILKKGGLLQIKN